MQLAVENVYIHNTVASQKGTHSWTVQLTRDQRGGGHSFEQPTGLVSSYDNMYKKA